MTTCRGPEKKGGLAQRVFFDFAGKKSVSWGVGTQSTAREPPSSGGSVHRGQCRFNTRH